MDFDRSFKQLSQLIQSCQVGSTARSETPYSLELPTQHVHTKNIPYAAQISIHSVHIINVANTLLLL